jgi:hypothetical protein
MLGLRRFSPVFAVLLLCVLPLRASIPPVPTNTWQQGGALSTARTGATATLMADGRILIVGGKDGNGNALETAEVLNPDGTIAPVPSMLAQRYGHSAILLHDGNVLVAGGHTSGGGVVNSAELFDPVANTWQWAANTMADPRADFTLSQLIDGNILVAGGDNGSGPISGVEKFDLLTKSSSTSDLLMQLARRMPHPCSTTVVCLSQAAAQSPRTAQRSRSPRQRSTIPIQQASARDPRSTSGALLIQRPLSLTVPSFWLAETMAAPTSPPLRFLIQQLTR